VVNEKLPTPDDWADVKREAHIEPVAATDASISANLLQGVIDAARDAVPNEAAGLLVASAYAADGGSPLRYISLRNAAESPYRYLIDAEEQLRVWIELEDGGEVPWAIVHSHVASPAVPSATDVGLAFFPESLYVICSLADPERPTVRAWLIREGSVSEVPLAVTES
jgi:[CysO sulfur-carrier protein]-S-L-cysteine hydrolase